MPYCYAAMRFFAVQHNALWPMILSLLVPSIVLLILGSALALVLTGYRREKPL